MPFRNSPDNMNALRMLGQTLVQGRQQEARTRLQIAIAQQAAARQARQDALQAGVWEAQTGRAKTQAALNATRQKEIDDRIAAIEQLSSVMGDTNNTPESAAVRAALMRVAGHGRQHIIENAAQLNSLGDPRLRALMATGSRIGPIPAGATMPDAATGEPSWTAPFAPNHAVGAEGSLLNALANAAGLYQITPGAAPVEGKANMTKDDVERYNAIIKALQSRISNLPTNGVTQPTGPTPIIRHQPQARPTMPAGASIPGAPDSNAFLYEVLRRAQVMPSQDQADANAAEVMRRLGPVQAAPSPGPTSAPGAVPPPPSGPVTEYIYDEATGKIVPVTRPPER